MNSMEEQMEAMREQVQEERRARERTEKENTRLREENAAVSAYAATASSAGGVTSANGGGASHGTNVRSMALDAGVGKTQPLLVGGSRPPPRFSSNRTHSQAIGWQRRMELHPDSLNLGHTMRKDSH
ncbi:unnamed protein product [Hapterophycus canaliculatus]